MRFENEFEFLSNFSESEIILDGIIYPTVEHFFQAMKTKDPIQRAEIAAAPTPGKAKRLGRQVQLRSDWEEVKDQCMLDALRLKFADEDFGYKSSAISFRRLEINGLKRETIGMITTGESAIVLNAKILWVKTILANFL